MIDLSASTAGTYTVTYTTAGTCSNSASTSVTINALDDATFSYAASAYCADGTDPTPTVTTSGGTFSAASGLSINTSTGVIDLSASTAGTYTVTYTTAGTCPNTATASITVNATPTITGTAAVCVGSTTTLTGSGTAASSTPWASATTSVATVSSAGVVTGVAAGTSVITYTDNNGCSVTQTVTVNVLPVTTITSSDADNTICSGESITLTADAGTTGYTFQWYKDGTVIVGATSSTYSATTTGTYTVAVTNNSTSCTATTSSADQVDVVVKALPTAALASDATSNTICAGESVTFTASGGTTYEFFLNGSSVASASTTSTYTTSSLSNSDVVTVEVTNANNCSATSAGITMTVNMLPTVVVTSSSNVACYGAANGSINVTATGASTISYSWSDGASYSSTSEDLVNLAPGTYSVTITDGNGCTAGTSATIIEPSSALSATTTSTDATGYGLSNGTATVTPAGGTSPYTYMWSDGQTTATATGLSAGTYTVVVTDANGCTTTETVVIDEPDDLVANGTSDNDVSCNGGSDGQVTVSVTGGVSPYTYSWNTTPAQTTQNATGLSAGSYTVTVTDANSNVTTETVTITEPTALSGTVTGTNVACNGGSTGSADLTVTGGTIGSGYTYSWSDGTNVVATTEDLSGVAAGTYTVTVTDANGCTTSESVTITEPVVLSATTTSTDATGYGLSNGTATVTPAGGTSPYTYMWSDGQTTATATGLSAGTYTVVVTDANGCTTTETVVIDEPDDLVANGTSDNDVSCNGGSDGQVTVSVTGGVSPYTYSWNTTPAQTTQNATGLSVGTYTVTVTDANGNIAIDQITVTEPTLLVATSSSTDVTCSGNSDGALDGGAYGGTAPYTFSWSNGITNEDQSGIVEGTYTLTVTDANGCTATSTSTVGMTDNVAPIAVAQNITVQLDATGQVSITSTQVDNGSSDDCGIDNITLDKYNFNCSDIGANTVTLTAMDVNGNSSTTTATVTVEDNIAPVITCPSDITAYADATTNGTAVTWTAATATDNCSIQSITSDIANGSTFTLGTTTVTYTVIDGSGNSAVCTFNVTVLDTVSPVITNCPSDITQNNDAGNCNAVVTWTAPTYFDNSGSYTVVWSHNSGDVFAVGTTTVTATVTDAAGNTTICSFDVTVEDNEAPVVTAPADVTVNADAGSCDAASSGVVIGTPAVSDNCGIASTTNNVPTAYTLGSNTVTWTVTDIHGNTTTVTQTVTVLDAENPVITCPGDFTAYAAADSTLTSVNWSAAIATDNCSIDTIYSDIQIGAYLPLGATTITYVAIDGSGNSDTCSFNITVVDTVSPVITGCPGPITQNNNTDSCGAVVSWTAPVYYDNSDYFTVTASHASGDYFPVGTTTVTITVADSAGNTSVCEFDITVVDNQVPDVVPFNSVSITLGTDGMYTLTVPEVDSASYDNCGIANRYLSHTFFNCNDVPTASTWLVVEDVHGNKDSSLVTLSVSLPATPVLSITETLGDVLCYGDATGYAQLAVSGGVAPYSYNWSLGSTTFEATGLSLGSYWYEVTDTNGCYSTDTVAIGQPDSLYATTVKSLYTGGYNVSINGASDGSITTSVTGGLTPYTFDWNTGAYSTQNLSGVPAGVYYLTLTDSNGCIFNVIDTLVEPTALSIKALSLQSVICPDDTSGIAFVTASGAVPPYTYSWDFGATTDYVSGLSYGIYTVTVTDTNGAIASDTVLVDALDYDCDGIYNVDEGGSPNGGGGDGDIDGDGIPNEEDEDSDGDGLLDSEEFDYDNDGVGFDDCDGDGIPNFLDPDLCDLLIPAVFTPNGDGDNDTWEILGIHAFPDNNVQVFNRWGELVYFKEGYDNEFNGRSNFRTQMNGGDGLLPTGTYYYIVKVYATGDTYTGYVYITK